jgi:SPP1 family predicted phage head-tail adaptor
VNAGSLNRRITIQKPVNAQDEAGQQLQAWDTVCQRWANVSGQTGMGTITGAQENVSASVERYSIRIRYFEGVAAGMRAVLGDKVFTIRQVRHDIAKRDYTDLVCELGGRQ